jgi:hypothetical protein
MAQKGNNFEREVSRALSLWWTGGEEDDVFWRNRVRRTGKAYNAQMQEGDLIATKEIGVPFTEFFCVECKSGYSIKRSPTKKTKEKKKQRKTVEKTKNVPWDLLEVIDSDKKKPVILSFWEQVDKAGELTHRMPILIFKRDFHTPVVVVGDCFHDAFFSYDDLNLPPVPVHLTLAGCVEDTVLTFYKMDDFLKMLPPDTVHRKWKEKKYRARGRK